MNRSHSFDPDEIFIDATNLPGLDPSQFEGRVERPVSFSALFAIGLVFMLAVFLFAGRAFYIGVAHGNDYRTISESNRFNRTVVFATRGTIEDRTGMELAWNETKATTTQTDGLEHTYALRKYATLPGLAHVVGFVRYPKADARGAWWREEYTPVSGVEFSYDELLRGINGSQMEEANARGEVTRTQILTPPTNGDTLHLSIDAEVQSTLYTLLLRHANTQGFKGGAAVIMDVTNGEILSLTSFPEYDHAAFADGNTAIITETNTNNRTPALNRAVAGVYTPGSIVKPLFALAALEEGIIDPAKQIYSSGALILPNPYNPSQPSIFRDWRAHGWVDMRHAIAQSSDEYFYTIGGGFGDQKGLGIQKIDAYAKLFGLASTTGVRLGGELPGVIPTPEWKEKVFGADDPWRIGNTYHTAIGQFGFQVTPIQMARYISAIANGGALLVPHLTKDEAPTATTITLDPAHVQVIREGMRLAVTSPLGTSKAENISGIVIAGKTGTAQLGTRNQYMNSWAVGFWPYENPRYAYAVLLENAPAGTLSGAAPAMRPFFEWLIANKPEYTTMKPSPAI